MMMMTIFALLWKSMKQQNFIMLTNKRCVGLNDVQSSHFPLWEHHYPFWYWIRGGASTLKNKTFSIPTSHPHGYYYYYYPCMSCILLLDYNCSSTSHDLFLFAFAVNQPIMGSEIYECICMYAAGHCILVVPVSETKPNLRNSQVLWNVFERERNWVIGIWKWKKTNKDFSTREGGWIRMPLNETKFESTTRWDWISAMRGGKELKVNLTSYIASSFLGGVMKFEGYHHADL